MKTTKKSQATKAELHHQLWDMHFEFGTLIGRVADEMLRMRRSSLWATGFTQDEYRRLHAQLQYLQGALRRMDVANRKAVQDAARRCIRSRREAMDRITAKAAGLVAELGTAALDATGAAQLAKAA